LALAKRTRPPTTFSHLLGDKSHHEVTIGPLQYSEVDIGEVQPARCLNNALFLLKEEAMPFIVLITPAEIYGQASGVQLEIAVPAGELGKRKFAVKHGHFYALRLLEALGIKDVEDGVLRFSLFSYNSEEEIEKLCGALNEILLD
jgi:cysteine sulfinate desulfinase/cysteine desulfurase-like protein